MTRYIEGVSPFDRGRLAFWDGRTLAANPCAAGVAAQWRAGWQDAAKDYVLGGGRPEGLDLARLRPKDLPAPVRPHPTRLGNARRVADRMRGLA